MFPFVQNLSCIGLILRNSVTAFHKATTRAIRFSQIDFDGAKN